jgi:hypothetical protein
VFIVQASQHVVPRGGISLGKWRSSFAESSDGKMNAKSACTLNTPYKKGFRLSICAYYSWKIVLNFGLDVSVDNM